MICFEDVSVTLDQYWFVMMGQYLSETQLLEDLESESEENPL